MGNMFSIAGFAAVIYFIFKVIEMRFKDKEEPPTPMKELVRDTLIVYVSVLASIFVMSQVSPIMEKIEPSTMSIPQVFTDNPNF